MTENNVERTHAIILNDRRVITVDEIVEKLLKFFLVLQTVLTKHRCDFTFGTIKGNIKRTPISKCRLRERDGSFMAVVTAENFIYFFLQKRNNLVSRWTNSIVNMKNTTKNRIHLM